MTNNIAKALSDNVTKFFDAIFDVGELSEPYQKVGGGWSKSEEQFQKEVDIAAWIVIIRIGLFAAALVIFFFGFSVILDRIQL